MGVTNKLANKNILVIGGPSGIGFAVAQKALEDGAYVTVSSSSEERVSSALDRLRASNPERALAARSYGADLSIRDKLEKTIKVFLKYTAELSPIDHIVLTAGNVPPLVPLAEASFDVFEAFLTVWFFGAMVVGKFASNYMTPSKYLSITLMTGTQSKKPSFWLPPAVAGAVGEE